MNTLLGLLAVIALVAGNAWFVAAEFAFVASRRSRLQEAADGGDRGAKRALWLMERLSFALSGAQLGITVTSLAVGFIAEPVFTALLRPLLGTFDFPEATLRALAVGVGLAISTVAQMVFGELGPKNFAIAKPEPVARSLAGGQAVYLRIFGPVIRLFDSAANGIVRSIGIEPAEEIGEAVTVEELERIISSSQKAGSLDQQVTNLLHRSLEFRNLRAADAMRPRSDIASLTSEQTASELLALAETSGYSRFPVTGTDGLDDLHGVVSVKELLGLDPEALPITPLRTLVEDELAVPESAPLDDVLSLLRDAHTQMAVVIDEHGGTAGIITLEDVIEELFGDIRDEHDASEGRPLQRSDGAWRLPGWWRIDEVRRDTGIRLPAGEHDTITGLVMSRLGRIPKEHDQVTFDSGATITVVAVKRYAITSVVLTAPSNQNEVPR